MSRRYKAGVDRHQELLLPTRVEDYVAADNPVRAIDAYVEGLDLGGLGFQHASGGVSAGQPAYPPAALLKLYLYGYLMRMRSSRLLERETYRNLEVIWLLEGRHPSYKTIADFRKDNAPALKAVNRDFVLLCKEVDLYGGELVAVDGSFFRGNVAKGSIYTTARLRKLLAKIEHDIETYLQELEQADASPLGSVGTAAPLAEKLAALKQRQTHYQGKLAALHASGESQYAEVDADARLLTKRGQSVAGYNVQMVVEAKHKLLVTVEVTADGNDTGQLAPMAQHAQAVLGVAELKVVADAGYYNVLHLKACQEAGITPYVPVPDHHGPVNPATRLGREAFTFEADHNRYRCPQGQYVTFRGVVAQGGKQTWRYASSERVCARCPVRMRCLSAKTPYREIYRWEHEALLEAHKRRMAQEGPAYLKRRAGLAEHPFGTLKRWCGWVHFLVRGKEKVSGEMHLLMLCYNFKRVLSLLGPEGVRVALQQRARPPAPPLIGEEPQEPEKRTSWVTRRLRIAFLTPSARAFCFSWNSTLVFSCAGA